MVLFLEKYVGSGPTRNCLHFWWIGGGLFSRRIGRFRTYQKFWARARFLFGNRDRPLSESDSPGGGTWCLWLSGPMAVARQGTDLLARGCVSEAVLAAQAGQSLGAQPGLAVSCDRVRAGQVCFKGPSHAPLAGDEAIGEQGRVRTGGGRGADVGP